MLSNPLVGARSVVGAQETPNSPQCTASIGCKVSVRSAPHSHRRCRTMLRDATVLPDARSVVGLTPIAMRRARDLDSARLWRVRHPSPARVISTRYDVIVKGFTKSRKEEGRNIKPIIATQESGLANPTELESRSHQRATPVSRSGAVVDLGVLLLVVGSCLDS